MSRVHGETLFLIQGLILVGLPYFLWRIKVIRQLTPLVVVQIMMGIVLGPSILGKLSPSYFEALFPKESLSAISGLSWIGIIFFGFLTGTHFDVADIKGKGKPFLITSLASIVVPFVCCLGIGWQLFSWYPEFAGANANQLTFTLAVAIAAAVTALPVLSATMIDMGMMHTPIGKKALGCATVNDGLLWVLVSILLALALKGTIDIGQVGKTIGLTALYLSVMFFVVQPILQRLVKKGLLTKHPHNGQLVGLTFLLFISALTTELIGVHFLLGAFVFGTTIPKVMVESLHHKVDPIVSVVFLPFFFMSTGLKTEFAMNSAAVWGLFAVMTIVSSITKVIGTAIPCRLVAKYSWQESWMLGGFMQCKGLMEVIVLNMMLSAKIISPDAFSGLILMAVATTALTKPFVLFIKRLNPNPYSPHAVHETA